MAVALAIVLDVGVARLVAIAVHQPHSSNFANAESPSSGCIDGSTLEVGCTTTPVAPAAAATPITGKGYGPLAGCPLLSQGSRGECVRRLQVALQQLGVSDLRGTGVFGPRTYRAVVELQRAHPPIRASGIVGFRTQAALLKDLTRHNKHRPDEAQPSTTAAARIVASARRIMNGKGPGWDGGKSVPYEWGGGHEARPGPSTGTCVGYEGPPPCEAESTSGLDCSGFVRWAYALAYHGQDVLGPGNTDAQRDRTTKVDNPGIGDLVFFGTADGSDTHHVGIYIGDNKMINAPDTGQNIQIDKIDTHDLVGYFRLDP